MNQASGKKEGHEPIRGHPQHFRLVIDIIQLVASLGSLAGFAYLIADLQYQSAPSIAPAASDPKDPFRFPFLLVNNSHLTSLRKVSWTCHVGDAVMIDGSHASEVDGSQTSPVPEIGPGHILNLQCPNIPAMDRSAMKELTMTIDVQYDSDVVPFVPVTSHQQSSFEWYAGASMPQWLKK